MSNTRSLRRKAQKARGFGGLIPYEVALNKDGKPQQGSPWSDEAVKNSDIGDYFFYPDKTKKFIDIIVLARDEEDAIQVARTETWRIIEAGKWGIDHW